MKKDDEMEDVKLLPCPFCGGSAEFGRHEAYSTDSSFDCIRCAECDAMMEYEERRWDYEKKEWDYSSIAYAIAAWNTRTSSSDGRAAEQESRHDWRGYSTKTEGGYNG